MAFRTLTVDSAAEIHVRGGQLTVQRACDARPLQIDLDDIACIVLSNLDITFSTGALDMISQYGITILGCGRNYMPTSIMLPFARNSRYSEIVDAQLSMSLPLKKRFWKAIVKKKIGQTRSPQSRASCSTRRASPRTSSGCRGLRSHYGRSFDALLGIRLNRRLTESKFARSGPKRNPAGSP